MHRFDHKVLSQTRLGNTGILRGANPQDSAALLNTSLEAIAPDLALDGGNWVLTWECEPLAPLGAGETNQALIRVTFGEGGASTTIELSASPGGCIQLAAGSVKVDAVWDNQLWGAPDDGSGGNGPGPGTFAAAGFTFPDVNIKAFIHRGFAVDNAFRGFNLRRPALAAAGSFFGRIPRLAKRGMLYSTLGDLAFYSAAVTLVLFDNPPPANAFAVNWLGTELDALRASGRSVIVPAKLSEWQVVTPAVLGFGDFAQLWFELGT